MDINDYIISQTAGNLFWKDRQGKYLGCNLTFSNMIGLTSPGEIIGKTDRDLFLRSLGEEKVKLIIELDQEIIHSGQAKTIEEIGVDANKKIAYYLTRKLPLKDKYENIIGIMGTSIDITEAKQAAIAKKEFLENMSHDVRTPLAGIYGLSEILYDYCTGEEIDKSKIKRIAEDITKSSQALMNLMNEVLEISRIGCINIRKEEFNIKTLIDDIFTLMSAKINFKKLAVKINCPNVLIKEYKFHIFRILLNLIGNAVKFTKTGSITINCYPEKDFKIEVEDTGIGIPDDKLNKIFDIFFKVTPSYKTGSFNGCGTGLYLSQKLAKDIGGKIDVESTINSGSKFTFSKIYL